MAAKHGDYELLDRGTILDQDISNADDYMQSSRTKASYEPVPKQTTYLDHQSKLNRNTIGNEETPKIALDQSVRRLLFSFLIHLIPCIATVGIIQLTIFNVYWFDNDDSSDKTPWKSVSISLNELLNGLQFIAKLHEIFLVISLSAIMMHFVRIRLLSDEGLPFGLLASGFSVGSAEYLFSKPFGYSGIRRKVWIFSLSIIAATLLANMLGPTSAIVLIPNLAWWKMKNPFGSEELPVYIPLNSSEIWQQRLTNASILIANENYDQVSKCYSPDVTLSSACPAAGWQSILSWTVANAERGAPPTVTVMDLESNVQRSLTSRLTERKPGHAAVSITTTLSHGITTTILSFWQYLLSGEYPVNSVIRPKLSYAARSHVYQPVVQVQCEYLSLSLLKNYRESRNLKVLTPGINTFSRSNASAWDLPDWIYDFEYSPNTRVGEDGLTVFKYDSLNITWVELPGGDENGNDSLSLAALIVVPTRMTNADGSTLQQGTLYECSIDARWAGSSPEYDPSDDRNVHHNITDPLVFAKKYDENRQPEEEANRLGVSRPISISSSFADSLNFVSNFEGIVASTLQLLLTPYVTAQVEQSETAPRSNGTATFHFSPSTTILKDSSVLGDPDQYYPACAETIATVLGLLFTDGIARLGASIFKKEGRILSKHMSNGDVEVTSLAWLNGQDIFDYRENVTTQVLDAHLPTSYNWAVERYGYGYGFGTATVAFGVSILLIHVVCVVLYVLYATYDFLYGRGWTSSAWGDLAEFAALLINSQPTAQLQNTCAGIESKSTWQKNIRIKECSEGHLGVVVGEDSEATTLNSVQPGVKYGTLI